MLKPENIVIREFIKNILDKDFATANKSLQDAMNFKLKNRISLALESDESIEKPKTQKDLGVK